jgi:O-antigen/teichoic acid export membrane protein
MSELQNNKRIAKNTLFLYFRMIIIMGVNLYTVRVVLNILGAEDYGIYNVVGGVVTLFTFLTSTLSSSSQRFFSYELGCNNYKRLNEIFSLNITLFVLLVIIILIIAETVGLWFINTQLTIPIQRLSAANWVFQFSLFSFVATLLAIPYNALIIAHERMSAYAYISIVEALLKLAIVFSLFLFSWDSLKLYAILIFFASFITAFSYYIYCRKVFSESNYYFYWNKKLAMDLINYSGWHFLGSISVVIRSQGINILLNIFFNPIVNAARAIAYQVNAAINSLSNNFFSAVKPQIYKLYAANEITELHQLMFRSSRLCFYLMLFLAMPIYLEIDYLLNIWLKNVPEYTVLFTKLVLINALIDSISSPAIASALATGKIKKFELITGILMVLNLPVSYIFLKLGYDPQITMITSIIISSITIWVRAHILKELTNLSIKDYNSQVILPLIRVTVISFLLPFYISTHLSQIKDLVQFGIIGAICFISISLSVLLVGLSKTEKDYIILYIRHKFISK